MMCPSAFLPSWTQADRDGHANERVRGTDLKGLRSLRGALGDRFIAGIAFSTGARSYNYEDRIYVMPLDRLWRPIP